jgi:hypothetical protein
LFNGSALIIDEVEEEVEVEQEWVLSDSTVRARGWGVMVAPELELDEVVQRVKKKKKHQQAQGGYGDGSDWADELMARNHLCCAV